MLERGDGFGLKSGAPEVGTRNTLGIKMCGNCNPDIQSMRVVKRIAAELSVQMVPYGEGKYSLTLSACGAACVEEVYSADIVIRGLECGGSCCTDEDELVEKAVRILEQLMREDHREDI